MNRGRRSRPGPDGFESGGPDSEVPDSEGAPSGSSDRVAPVNRWAVAALAAAVAAAVVILLAPGSAGWFVCGVPGLFLGIHALRPDPAGRRRHRATTAMATVAIVAYIVEVLLPLAFLVLWFALVLLAALLT